ncbi:MAG: hypothetical protein U0798_04165 [Gemmataceae bacterium]
MRNDALSFAALKYAAGELSPVDAAGFELKLADDPAARDALEEAVRLSAAAVGQPSLMPDPLYRDATIESLRPTSTWLGRVFARRPYRGHPLTWTGAGAGAMALFASLVWLASPAPQCLDCPKSSDSNIVATAPAPFPSPIPPIITDTNSATSSTAGGNVKGTNVMREVTIPTHSTSPSLKPIGKG